MPRPSSTKSESLPLLSWPENSQIDALENDRRLLIKRIEKLPPHAHRRIQLEARLIQFTHEQIRLANQLRKTE